MPRDKIQELVFTKNAIAIKVKKVKDIAFAFKAIDSEDSICKTCGISSAYLRQCELWHVKGKKKLIELKEWKE